MILYNWLPQIRQFIKKHLNVSPIILFKSPHQLNGYVGFYYRDYDKIEVSDNLSEEDAILTILHEAAHAYCIKTGKYKIFHKGFDFIENKHEMRIFLDTMIKAEMYVELLAQKLARKFKPEYNYFNLTSVRMLMQDLANYKQEARKLGLI